MFSYDSGKLLDLEQSQLVFLPHLAVARAKTALHTAQVPTFLPSAALSLLELGLLPTVLRAELDFVSIRVYNFNFHLIFSHKSLDVVINHHVHVIL